MENPALLIQIRTRKLGVLIYDARLATNASIEECAQAMGVSSDVYPSYESGQQAPSLPALESLAHYLNVPLEHFWGQQSLSQKRPATPPENHEQRLQLRDRIISARLRQQRNERHLSTAELAEGTSLSEEQVKDYELGQTPIPLPYLEVLASKLEIELEDLFDQPGSVASWNAQQDAYAKFASLPPEIQDFVGQAANQPYLALAMKLSQLPAEKLRSIAQSLLEIINE